MSEQTEQDIAKRLQQASSGVGARMAWLVWYRRDVRYLQVALADERIQVQRLLVLMAWWTLKASTHGAKLVLGEVTDQQLVAMSEDAGRQGLAIIEEHARRLAKGEGK